VLTLVAAVIALGWFAMRNPIVLEPVADERVAGTAAEAPARGDVLVVLPTVSEALTLDQLSTDEAWLNAIEQEIGRYRTVETSALSRSVMDTAAWVIIPRKAASQLDPTQTQFVRNWVEDGGTVLVEQPIGPWRSLTGQAQASARLRDTRRITSFDGALTRGEMRADILELPLRTTLLPYAPANLARGRDYQVLMEVDGQPGVVGLNIGRGHVILILFDFGRASVWTQQGLPNPDFTLRRAPDLPLPPDVDLVDQLVIDPALRTSRIPFIDLLERNLLYLADVHRPVGRLWHYPATYRGALLVTHSEARFGADVEYMTQWEHAAEERSSVFAVATSLTPETLARLARTSVDVQLQWVPTAHPAAPVRTWGLRGFRPVRRAMNLAEQRDQLQHDLIPYGPTLATRTMDALWTTDYFAAFAQLEAAGIALDLSYGPSPATFTGGEAEQGYLFGTGMPFRPIDQSGHRYRIQELPVTVDAGAAGYSTARVRELIIDAAEGYHTTIVGDWRPNVMAWRPSFDAIDGWQQAYRLARSQELWVTTISDYVAFLQQREQSTVSSEFSAEQRRLTITIEAVGPTRGTEDAVALTPSLAFPARYQGRPVERLTVDGVLTETSALGLTGDRVLHLLPLEPGEHRVQVVYGSPLELPIP
jgi:hypothetical protein